MLIRSMTPQVIVADEIGTIEDIEAIKFAMSSGCKGIFTAHGKNIEEIYINPVLKELLNSYMVDVIIFLDDNGDRKNSEIYLLYKKILKYEKNVTIGA